MRTAIKTIIAAAFSTIILTSSAFASTTNTSDQVTTLTNVQNVSSIKVSGNVELILIQSNNESVKVYDNYYSKNALVQQQNGSLFISSFEKEKLTVVVYVNNLKNIEATDNATIVTKGELNLFSLAIKLQRNASANLNLSVIDLSTDVTGQSDLTLGGTAASVYVAGNSVAKLNMAQFKAESTVFKADNRIVAQQTSEDLESINFGLGK